MLAQTFLTPEQRALLANANQPGGALTINDAGEVVGIFKGRDLNLAGVNALAPAAGEIITPSNTHDPRVGDGATMGGLLVGLGSPATVFVGPTRTAKQSALHLLEAYTRAKALTPGGSALSATNRARLLIAPGHYDFDTVGQLTLDTAYVDIVGLGGSSQTIFNVDGGYYLDHNVGSVILRGLTLYAAGNGALMFLRITAADTLHEDLVFVANAANPGLGAGTFLVASSLNSNGGLQGTYRRIRGNCSDMYGGITLSSGVSATFEDCQASVSNGNGRHWGSGGNGVLPSTFTGTHRRCISDGNCFVKHTGLCEYSRFKAHSGNNDGIIVGAGFRAFYSKFVQAGSGVSIDRHSSEEPTVSVAGCLLNGTPRAEVTNNLDAGWTTYNVVDADLT